jgi:hypothetical protein
MHGESAIQIGSPRLRVREMLLHSKFLFDTVAGMFLFQQAFS